MGEKTEHGFAPPRAFGGEQNAAVKGYLKVLQRRERGSGLSVHRHIGQRVALAVQIGQDLAVGFQTACKLVFAEIQMLRGQRRVGFVALRHRKARFHVRPKARGFGVHVADADKQRLVADVVEHAGQLVFKKQRQIIFHPCTEMAAAHRLIHGGGVMVGVDFLAETGAEDFLRVVVGGELVRRQQADFGNRCDGALRIGVEGFDAVDFVAEQIQAVRQLRTHRENIQNTAAHGEFARGHHVGNMAVTRVDQIAAQGFGIQRLPRFQPKRAPEQKRHRREFLHGGGHRHDQHVGQTAFHLPQRGQTLRHQILMRRKALIGQRFPIGQKHGLILRAEKLPGNLQAQRLLDILRENHFQRFFRQALR